MESNGRNGNEKRVEAPATVTIRDVAQLAQVSITTVSHVFNRPHRVAEATRQRVLDAAAELSYRPNIHARQLVTGQNRTLAIQIAGQTVQQERALIPNSEYFLDVLNGAARAADEAGYALMLTPPDVDPFAFDGFAVGGVVLVDPAGEEAIFGQVSLLPRLVTTGRPNLPSRSLSVVDNNHTEAAVEVMDHLHASGFRRPAVLVNDSARSYVQDLVAGYRKWAKRRRLAPVIVDLGAHASMTEAFDEMTALGVDAVYTSSENIALDVLLEARRREVRIPADLGLCSAVDSSVLRLTSPQISGVFLHPHEIGRSAGELLIGLVEGQTQPGRTVNVKAELRVRGSTHSV